MPLAIEVAFVLLTVAMLADWLSHREHRRAYLALAFGSLTLLVLLAPSLSKSVTRGPYGPDCERLGARRTSKVRDPKARARQARRCSRWVGPEASMDTVRGRK